MNPSNNQRPMTHEERIRLIMKPFPQINVIRSSRGWYGVTFLPQVLELHKRLNGLVPRRTGMGDS